MSGFEFTPEALEDIQEIWLWIAQDNPEAADKLEADIYRACELLAGNPHLGHKRPDLTRYPLRFWTVRSHYIVVYDPVGKPLRIVRVLHGARDITADME